MQEKLRKGLESYYAASGKSRDQEDEEEDLLITEQRDRAWVETIVARGRLMLNVAHWQKVASCIILPTP